MKIYLVGGAVRDEIMGLSGKDKDYVVVGATPEEMVKLGYKPVGKDFPVFLHPKTHHEYALARTERKISKGYKGFKVYASKEVTLEEDLKRRDLTINAIAKDSKGQFLIPFKVSRHKIKFYGMLAQLCGRPIRVYASLDFLLDFISSKYIQRRSLF